MRKTYSGTITKLEPNQIFVFGSNTQGRYGAGAAAHAISIGRAIYGQSRGFQRQSYAICTKDLTKKVHPSISENEIEVQIADLYWYAIQHPELEFLIAYSGKGTNLNGYTPQQMAKMFTYVEIPDNIVFEEEFNKLIEYIRNG